jgi:hypothetical protein
MVDTDMGGGQWIEVPAGENTSLLHHPNVKLFFVTCAVHTEIHG